MSARVSAWHIIFTCAVVACSSGCRSQNNPSDARAATRAVPIANCPECARARLENKWCEKCKVGYVAGVPLKSKLLFEGLDAHGHTLMLETFTCPTCKQAIAEDGFCTKCRIGFLHKQAYFSRLTYELAHGEPVDVDKLTCPICKENSKHYGWCDKCKVGMVGNVKLKDRKNYDAALRPFDVMLIANEAGARCEMCALAIVTDTHCFVCKIDYKDGKPVQAPAKP